MRKQTFKERVDAMHDRKVGWACQQSDRELYLAQKAARENTPDEQYRTKVRLIVQAATKREDEAYKIISDSMQHLMDDTFQLIKNTLKEYDEDIMYVSDETIKKVLNDTSLAVKRIQSYCAEPKYQAKLNPLHPSLYEKLFIQLIEKVDVRFALYAPQRSLIKLNFKFEKLSKENRAILFDRIKEFGLFNDEEYLQRYQAVFEEQLKGRKEEYSL